MKPTWNARIRPSARRDRRDENPRGSERGSSLIEFLIITLVFGMIIAGALGFMVSRQHAFREDANQLATVQDLRYGYQALEIDISTLGNNVPAGQPSLVLAGEDVLAFTGDHRSNLMNDRSALYIDPDASDEMVQLTAEGVELPNSAYSWPDTVYEARGGTPSPAELIIFFFDPDTTTARPDDYVLMRQVNHGSPVILSRNIVRQGSTPFFRYLLQHTNGKRRPALDSIPNDDLPLFHSARIHGSKADTAESARIDLIRAVRVSFRSINGLIGEKERFSDLSRVIELPDVVFHFVGSGGGRAMPDGN